VIVPQNVKISSIEHIKYFEPQKYTRNRVILYN